MATDASPPLDPSIEIELPAGAPPTHHEVYELAGTDLREKALPIRPGDLTRLLLAQPGLAEAERAALARLCPRLGSLFHHEFYQRLRDLKETYAPLDPDSDYAHIEGHTRLATESIDEEFLALFEATLERANYRALDNSVIQEAVSAPNELGLNYVPDFSLFEHLKVYARGYTKMLRVSRNVRTKFRKRTIILDAYQRLIVILKFKDGLKKLGKEARTDAVYLRMFKDVPHVDMEMHLPEQGTRVKMRWSDKAQIASPFVVSLPAVAAKMALAFAAFSPVVLGAAVVAPLSAGVNSFFGFQRAKQKHLSYMIRNLYYLTLANNGSVLTRLIDSAEEEEYKETILAYYFLWRHGDERGGLVDSRLDVEVERFLKAATGLEINFEIEDALGKLYRLGLARRGPDGVIRATPIAEAADNLDCLWCNAIKRG